MNERSVTFSEPLSWALLVVPVSLKFASMAVQERLGESDAETIGPDDVMVGLLIEGGLASQSYEVDTGAECCGVEGQFKRLQNSFVFIEGVVSGVAGKAGTQSRQANMSFERTC